jgi:hypothetical protein
MCGIERSRLARPLAEARPRRLLVFVNPVSGTRSARRTYAKVVKPMLEQAGIEHQLVGQWGGSGGRPWQGVLLLVWEPK